MNKKVYLKSWGCQMNDRDSEIIYGMLIEEGYERANSMNEADVILFNTCSVRKHAEDRAYGKVYMLKDIKKEKPGLLLGIVGCMAENYKGRLLEEFSYVDFICGPQNIYDIPDLLRKAMILGRRSLAVGKEERPIDGPKTSHREDTLKAYVSVSEGCNNYCSYCIVPFVRGRAVSRQKDDIVREVKDLVKRGFKEVTLLGQNVNSYGNNLNDGVGFAGLLEELDKTGIERLRFITSHPKDANEELFRAMRDLRSVCEHLHLPLQSGSDRILDLMNRRYTQEDFLRLVELLRKYLPDSAITTDIIVGFPGELEEDFQDTVRLMEKIGFDSAFIFKYSPRPPAKSSELEDDVPKKTKEARNQTLLKLQEGISFKKNQQLVGQETEILIEGKDKKNSQKLIGRTRTNKIVVVEGYNEHIGQLLKVELQHASPLTLFGKALR